MGNFDHVVIDTMTAPKTLRARDFAGALAVVAAGLLAGVLFKQVLAVSDIALMLLVAVQMVAVVYGLWPALAACLASVLGFNFLFIPPLYTLTVADPENVVTLLFFAVTALITSGLTSLVRSQALIARSARIQAASEKLRSALLSSVSHDLRTPLASILGSATTLKRYRANLDDDAQAQLIDTIQEEAERLNRFISDLLDMTKLEAGAVEARTELVDLSDVIGSASRRAADVLAHHRLAIDLEPDLPMVKLDPVLFEQVLFNLFDNAAKYAPQGTTIGVSASRMAQSVVLTVADEGEGIPSADLDRVFEKFYRSRAGDRQRAGTGLGLAISRGFVEAMGGTVIAENRNDRRGAAFTIELPVPVLSAKAEEHAA